MQEHLISTDEKMRNLEEINEARERLMRLERLITSFEPSTMDGQFTVADFDGYLNQMGFLFRLNRDIEKGK